jgi:KaiC/GvpD/RAD55 family RecA-like ATPase
VIKLRTDKEILLSLLISIYLLPFVLGLQMGGTRIVEVKENYSTAQKPDDAIGSGSIEVGQSVAGSFQENSTSVFQGGGQVLQLSFASSSASFTRHLMCKDHDRYYNPIEPTTIFRPSDTKAECLTTVSTEKDDTVDFRWFYRSNSSRTWVSCYNWSYDALYVGEQVIAAYLDIAGCGLYYPRAYKVEVYYLNSSLLFSEFFEITNGGLNSPRICEDVSVNGDPVNVKSRFTIGNDTKAYHYLRFDKVAYFNNETVCCHNFTTVWIQPDGTTYKTYSGSFRDYKDENVTWNYWEYGYISDDYISINSGTPVGNWTVEVYLDICFNNSTWMPYGPIATTPFMVGNETVADWTFMVYLDADNSLESAGIDVFLKMASVNSSSQVNVVVQMDRIPGYDDRYGNWTDCKRFNITKGMTPTPENAILNLTEVDMGDPNTLKDFVNWTISNYPANYYCLVLWDHGTGCMGICFDVTSGGNNLTLPELSQALSGLPSIMDVVLIDACSMGMAEVAYQIKDYANVLVSPEGIGWAPAPYDTYLSNLVSDSSMSPRDFSAKVVNDYIDWCWSIDVSQIPNATMSAIDLTKIAGLTETIDDFAINLREKETLCHEQISQARNLTQGYAGPFAGQNGSYIDLYHFAQQLTRQDPLDEELRNSAYQVMAALSIGNTIITHEEKADSDSHGLAIFFPDEKGKYDSFKSAYNKTAFSMDTPWDEFVEYDLFGCVLTIQTPYSGIPVKVNEESYTTDAYKKIQVFVAPGSYTVNVTTVISTGPDSRGVFAKWNDNITSNPRTLLVSTALTLEAEYETQYRLIMDANLGTTNPSAGEYWYRAHSTVPISSTTPITTSGERYVWLGWTGTGAGSYNSTGNPASIALDGPVNETATWRHEYYLLADSPNGSCTPTSGWFESGKSINASATSLVSGSAGTRYVCIGWTGTGRVSSSGTATSVTFTIDKPSSVTWIWKTQYLLVVHTNPAGLSPQPNASSVGPWYDNGTVLFCTAQEISEKVLDHWSVDGANWDRGINPITVTMDGPHEAIAHYVAAPASWQSFFRPEIQVILGLIGLALSIVLVRTAWIRTLRRRDIMKARAEPSAVEVPEVVLPSRITTGYGDLDSLLLGGMPENYAVILASPACDERDLLIKRFLEAGAKEGQITFYVTTEAHGIGALAEEFQASFYVFICNPRADAMIKSLPNVFKLRGVENLTEIIIVLTKAFHTLDKSLSGPRRACIEIVSDVLLQHHAVQTRTWLIALVAELRSWGFTTLAVMNPQMHSSEEVHAILDLFEGGIDIYEKETEKGLEKFLKVKKMHDQEYSEKEMPLKKERLETGKKEQSSQKSEP